MRVRGELEPLNGAAPLTRGDIEGALATILDDPQKIAEFEEQGEVDFSCELSGIVRLRVNAFRQRGSVALVCRTIPSSVPALAEIGVPPVVERLAQEPRGIVLVTGATGSGKSTTLAAVVDYINRNMARHIVTVEDPIEFVHENRRSIVNQREVGADTASFNRALRRVLRHRRCRRDDQPHRGVLPPAPGAPDPGNARRDAEGDRVAAPDTDPRR